LLLRYTAYGDANLDGSVNVQDFNLLASSYGHSSAHWYNGDFNYDGTVNILDFNMLASNYGYFQTASIADSSPVPEPLWVAPTLMLSSLLRRCRSRG
jgi:hypothetical protein